MEEKVNLPAHRAGHVWQSQAEPAVALTSYGAPSYAEATRRRLSPFYRAEAFGEGRSSLCFRTGHPGEGE
jgi:hypothetical protein